MSAACATLVLATMLSGVAQSDAPGERESALRTLLAAQDASDPCAAATTLRDLRDRAAGAAKIYIPRIEAELERAKAACGGNPIRSEAAPVRVDQVDVPAGMFLRGSNDADLQTGLRLCRLTYSRPDECTVSWFQAESPQRSVYTDAFQIDRHEVSNARYAQCIDAGACAPINYSACTMVDPATRGWRIGAPGHANARKAEHPAVCVNWDDANRFCRWAGGRLPTEAEWEKAARGTDGRTFPWGNDWNQSALNWGDLAPNGDFGVHDGQSGTSPPGSFASSVSPYGAHDMAGNVWEWTQDWYAADFYAHGSDRNPVNQTQSGGKGRTVRGGSWSFAGNGARTTYRYYEDQATRDDAVGFRCVRTP
jgi:formylglycine-generating enzyme required for sulfatase activity